MKFAKSALATATPTSLEDLFKVSDNWGAGFIILETAGTVNYGTKSAQPGIVGTRLELRLTHLRDIYVTAANVALTLIVQ
jgi:hypothetical protein